MVAKAGRSRVDDMLRLDTGCCVALVGLDCWADQLVEVVTQEVVVATKEVVAVLVVGAVGCAVAAAVGAVVGVAVSVAAGLAGTVAVAGVAPGVVTWRRRGWRVLAGGQRRW